MQILGRKVIDPKLFGRKSTHQSSVFGRKNPGVFHLAQGATSNNSESKRDIIPNLEKKY